jgi:hypothetical protein
LARGQDAKNVASGYEELDWDELIPDVITQHPWSPIVFKNQYRRIANFLYADWIALDFDSPETTLAEAVRIWSDSAHIIGTTRNHQKVKHPGLPKEQGPCDRFRVLLRSQKRCDNPMDYEFTVKNLQNRYYADSQATDPARFFYPCTSIVSNTAFIPDMYFQEIILAPHIVYAKPVPATNGRYFAGAMLCSLMEGQTPPVGKRNETLYMVACDLASQGLAADRIFSILNPLFPKARDFTEKEVMRTIQSAVNKKTNLHSV